MSTSTTTKTKPTAPKRRRRQPAAAKTKAAPKTKPATKPHARHNKRSTAEQDTLAAMAQAKAKPAARITGTNIKRVQMKLGDRKPSAVLGITPTMLGHLATGRKKKADLKEPARIALRDFGSALGSDTFYGQKLAGMLWAIEKGVKV